MLQILGYILLIAIVILLIRIGFTLIVRFCAIGIVAFLFVGMFTGALALLGLMNGDTAWTLTKWAFFIGTVLNIFEVSLHPLEAIREALKEAMKGSSGSPSSSEDSRNNDPFPGMHCCGNCRWNKSAYANNVLCSHNSAGRKNGVTDRCIDYCHK